MRRRIAILLSCAMVASAVYTPASAQEDALASSEATQIVADADTQTEADAVAEAGAADETTVDEALTTDEASSQADAKFEDADDLYKAEDDGDAVTEPVTEEAEENDIAGAEDETSETEDPAEEADTLSEGEAEAGKDGNITDYISVIPHLYCFEIDNFSEKTAYVAVIGKSTFEEKKNAVVSGCAIPSVDYDYIWETSSPDGKSEGINDGTEYVILASVSSNIVISESNACTDAEGGIWISTLRSENVKIGNVQDAATLKDGNAIGFSALVQKNNTVSIKWNAAAGSTKYDSFQLFKLKANGTWEQLTEKSKKRGYKVSEADFQKFDESHTDVYKLVCEGSAGTDSYVTTVAPMVYNVNSYEFQDTLEFLLSKVAPDEKISYEMELAEDKAFTNSVSDNYPSDSLDTIDYALSKKCSPKAVSVVFYKPDKSLKEGSTYYARVRTAFEIDGKKFTSAPSAVRSFKLGPVKCQLYGFYGKTYDEIVNGGFDNLDPTPSKAYCVFSGPDPSKVAGYEVLACDKPFGQYKTIKKIPAGSVKKWVTESVGSDSSQSDIDYNDIYSFEYEGLSPVTKYYAVRAISKVKKAAGGYAMGREAYATYSKVEGAEVTNSDNVSITLSFKSEKGVNEYWIYKDTVSANLSVLDANGNPVKELQQSQFVGKVRNRFKKSSSQEKLTFVDKKDMRDGVEYFYTIRPVYSKSFADTQKAQTFAGDNGETVPGYGTSLSDIVSGKCTMENVKVGNVKCSVENVKQVKISWGSVKNANKYYIFIAPKDSSAANGYFDPAKAVLVPNSPEKGSQEFKSRKLIVDVPKPGVQYVLGVSVGGEKTDSDYWTITDSIATYPSLPTKLSTDYNRDGNHGAKLTWTNPSADKDFAGNIRYVIEYRDDGGSWKTLTTGVSATSSSYKDTDTPLRRGIERAYRMIAVYTGDSTYVFSKNYTSTVKYCKPYRIAIANSSKNTLSSIALEEGSTAVVRVYFYDRDGDYNTVTDKKLERVRSDDSSIFDVASTNRDGDYVTIKINGKKRGTSKLVVRARDYDDDSSRLEKSISVSVRASYNNTRNN